MTAREDPLGIDDFERWWRVRERADIVRLVGALDPPSGAAGEAARALLCGGRLRSGDDLVAPFRAELLLAAS